VCLLLKGYYALLQPCARRDRRIVTNGDDIGSNIPPFGRCEDYTGGVPYVRDGVAHGVLSCDIILNTAGIVVDNGSVAWVIWLENEGIHYSGIRVLHSAVLTSSFTLGKGCGSLKDIGIM